MENNLSKLISFLNDLQERKIYYKLNHISPDSILVEIALPGERIEVEFMEDGTVYTERFKSADMISGFDALLELLDKYSD